MGEDFRGFNPQEMVLLFKFMSIYDAINANNATVYNWKAIILINMVVWHTSNADLTNNMPFQDNLLHLANNKDNQLLSLLYHIRNAIAHGQVEKIGEQISLLDKPNNNSTQRSAIGVINADSFFQFIQLFL